jgi:ABC-type transport system involved in Fe-S cluster assembly fused permease/ATPase subunit
VAFPELWKAEADKKPIWASLTLQIVPNLLGFSLSGMSVMLAFSEGKFLDAIRQGGKDNSYFRKVLASFFHFTLTLTIALLISYISQFYSNKYVSMIGVVLSIYGILLIMSVVSRIWHTARIFNKVGKKADGSGEA